MTLRCLHALFDAPAISAAPVVSCPVTRAAAVIDSVLNLDPQSGRSSTEAVGKVLADLRASAAIWPTTVAELRAHNHHAHDGGSEDDFVALGNALDKTLSVPTLRLPALQLAVRAGHFRLPKDNGVSALKLALNAV